MIKIDTDNRGVRHTLSVAASIVGSLTVVMVFVWNIVEPWANDKIEERLIAGNYAKSNEVKSLGRSINDNKQRLREIERAQDKTGTKLENVEKLQQKILDELIKSNRRRGQ